MGERKVLNKYYPVDFDPSKLPRNRRPKDELELVRFMLPMTVRCSTCGEYMYAGRKFNVKKETAKGEDYLGVRIFRFYLKCTQCTSPFTIKTDPKNGNYVCESGATRNFEHWRASQDAEAEVQAVKQADEELDTMTMLENRTMDAKEEMEDLERLDQLQVLRAKQAKVSIDAILRQRVTPQDGGQRSSDRDFDSDGDEEFVQMQNEIRKRQTTNHDYNSVSAEQESIIKRPRKDSEKLTSGPRGIRIKIESSPSLETNACTPIAGAIPSLVSAYNDEDESD